MSAFKMCDLFLLRQQAHQYFTVLRNHGVQKDSHLQTYVKKGSMGFANVCRAPSGALNSLSTQDHII